MPNDPRGSWSTFVASWKLLLAGGKATKTNERRSLANDLHDSRKRMEAKKALKYPAVEFTGNQALAVAHGFITAIKEANYSVYACSIMPAHVHIVMGRTERNITSVVGHLKSKAAHSLRSAKLHPFEEHIHDSILPSCWVAGCWKVFLDSPERVRHAVDYVVQNPLKERKPAQHWSFVSRYSE